MRTLSRRTVPSVSKLKERTDDFSFSAVNTNLKFFSSEESEASKVFPEISAFIFPKEADEASKLDKDEAYIQPKFQHRHNLQASHVQLQLSFFVFL